MTKNKNSSLVKFLIFIAAIQFILIGFLLFQTTQKKQYIIQNQEIIFSDSIEIATKKEEFIAIGKELTKLKEAYAAMGYSKDSMTAEIDEMLEALWNVEMGGAIDLDALNSKISKAKELISIKDRQIKQLKIETDSLTYEAKILKSEKEAQLQKITEMVTDNRQLSAKMKLAARVKAENILLEAFNKKNKALTKEPIKSKDIAKLVLSFTIADNKFTKLNTSIPFSYRLIDNSTGKPLTGENSGKFTIPELGELEYTEQQDILFDNTGQVVKFEWINNNTLSAGNYKVELYAENYEIGKIIFTLK